MKKNIAVILGAGKGSRMKLGYNKQFLELRDEPIIIRNIRTFENHCEIDGIYIVSSKDEIDKFKELIQYLDELIIDNSVRHKLEDLSKEIIKG